MKAEVTEVKEELTERMKLMENMFKQFFEKNSPNQSFTIKKCFTW